MSLRETGSLVLRLLKADMKVLYRSNATLFSLTLSFVIRTEIALAVEMNQGIRSAARARSFIRCATRMRRTCSAGCRIDSGGCGRLLREYTGQQTTC